jgi:hypothetical protein
MMTGGAGCRRDPDHIGAALVSTMTYPTKATMQEYKTIYMPTA